MRLSILLPRTHTLFIFSLKETNLEKGWICLQVQLITPSETFQFSLRVAVSRPTARCDLLQQILAANVAMQRAFAVHLHRHDSLAVDAHQSNATANLA